MSGKMVATGVCLLGVAGLIAAIAVYEPGKRVPPSAQVAQVANTDATAGELEPEVPGVDEGPNASESLGGDAGLGVDVWPGAGEVEGADEVPYGPEDAVADYAVVVAERTQSPSRAEAADVRQLLQGATVLIIRSDTKGRGSGAIVAIHDDSFEVLTAHHVVAGRNDLKVVSFRQIGGVWQRQEHGAIEVLDRDEPRDLATLRVNTPLRPDVYFRQKLARSVDSEDNSSGTGKLLAPWTITWSEEGFPQPVLLAEASRQSAVRVPSAPTVDYWVVPQASQPGVSGGPLVDAAGDLAGIASGNSGGKAYFINQQEIFNFLKKNSLWP